jgi:hypothetical protein
MLASITNFGLAVSKGISTIVSQLANNTIAKR